MAFRFNVAFSYLKRSGNSIDNEHYGSFTLSHLILKLPPNLKLKPFLSAVYLCHYIPL